MKLNVEELIKSLVELEKDYSFNEITSKSGVYNLKKMVTGVTTPTSQSWWKLHRAYPANIPEPSYVGNGRVFNTVQGNVTGSAHQADTMTINNELAQDDNKLTPEELTLIRLIRTKEKPVELTIELIAQVATSK